jgi:hypothetical protein
MKNIQLYEHFCINESERVFFSRHNQPTTYKERAKKTYGLSDNPTILQRTENFFQKMEDRLNRMAGEGDRLMKQKRAERGGGPNTGVELLFGLPSVIPSVLKRVFGPTKFELAKKAPKDDAVDLEFMRHTNEDFVKNELPSIRSEKQLEDNIADLYKRGDVRKGQSPVLDDIARNRANIFYTKQMNPNQQILQPNN